jgi:glycosyltransferase involved in cell wall biosynthesis
MTSSLVSIIIPVYNASQYIGQTLTSILSQSYPHIEIIAVDDGSKDNSLETLERFKCKKLKIIQQANKGAASARNKGLENSQGKFIKFWDADDIMNIQHIEEQVHILQNFPDHVASCKWGRFYTNNIADTRFVKETVWENLSSSEWIKRSLSQKEDMASSWLWLIPRKIITLAGGWNESLSLNDDFEFSMRILTFTKGVRFADKAIAYYRSGLDTNLANQKSKSAYQAALLSTQLGCEHLLKADPSVQMKRLCANRYQQWLYRIYPNYPDLCHFIATKIDDLGGSDIQMDGGRIFKILSSLLGWKMAKRIQILIYYAGYKPRHPHK